MDREGRCDCTAERRCDDCAEADFRALQARCKGPKYEPYPIDSPRPSAREGLHKPRGVLIPNAPVSSKRDGRKKTAWSVAMERIDEALSNESKLHEMARSMLARAEAEPWLLDGETIWGTKSRKQSG